MRPLNPEIPRCVVCGARNPEGAACKGAWCPRQSGIRKEHIRKDEFDPANEDHFRLQSRGGAWRYYRKYLEGKVKRNELPPSVAQLAIATLAPAQIEGPKA